MHKVNILAFMQWDSEHNVQVAQDHVASPTDSHRVRNSREWASEQQCLEDCSGRSGSYSEGLSRDQFIKSQSQQLKLCIAGILSTE